MSFGIKPLFTKSKSIGYLKTVTDEEAFIRKGDSWELDNEKIKRIDEDSFSDFIGYWRNNVVTEFLDNASPEFVAALRLNNLVPS